MNAEIDAPKRRGPPAKGTSIVKRAADNAGMSLRQLAKALGLPYPTIRTWHARKAIPDEAVREVLSRPPYAPRPGK